VMKEDGSMFSVSSSDATISWDWKGQQWLNRHSAEHILNISSAAFSFS
jgi:hypothetical protein